MDKIHIENELRLIVKALVDQAREVDTCCWCYSDEDLVEEFMPQVLALVDDGGAP